MAEYLWAKVKRRKKKMDINSVITKEEYNNIKQFDYDTFSMYLTKIVKLCVEESLKAIPSVMTHLSSQAGYLKDLSDKFYKNNKDLAEHRKIVAQTIEGIEGNNPGKPYAEILELAAVKSREVIANINKTSFGPNKNIDLEKFDGHLGKL